VPARQSRVSVGSALAARGCSDVNVLSARIAETLFTAEYGIFNVGGAKGERVYGSVDIDT